MNRHYRRRLVASLSLSRRCPRRRPLRPRPPPEHASFRWRRMFVAAISFPQSGKFFLFPWYTLALGCTTTTTTASSFVTAHAPLCLAGDQASASFSAECNVLCFSPAPSRSQSICFFLRRIQHPLFLTCSKETKHLLLPSHIVTSFASHLLLQGKEAYASSFADCAVLWFSPAPSSASSFADCDILCFSPAPSRE